MEENHAMTHHDKLYDFDFRVAQDKKKEASV